MDVMMPQLGETVREGKISTWFKQAGDLVEAGENLFEIETDKVSMEVQAIESGKLVEIRVAAGAVANVGTVIAVIGDDRSEAVAKPVADASPLPVSTRAPSPAPQRAARLAVTQDVASDRSFGPFKEVFTPTGNFGPASLGDMRITPLARRLIAQNGLETGDVAADVRAQGRTKVSARDVEAALARGTTQRLLRRPAGSEAVPLNRIRRQTAKHLASAWRDIPHVVQAMEVNFAAVSTLRERMKGEFRKRYDVSLTFLPFIARAVCLAIASYPQVNAAFDGEMLHVSKDVNLGLAVDLSHEGLVVPVLKKADQLSLPGLAVGLNKLVERARNGKLTPDDLEGGTYSITNNGSFGTLFTVPLINAPQVAILSTDAIRKKPVVVETEQGDAIIVQPVGVLAQSFDHRAFDGAYSAAFLQRVKDIIETRDWQAELA